MDKVKIFKALGDETRMKIIMKISERASEACDDNDPCCTTKHNICACKILEEFDCSQSTFSHHIKILTDAKIINIEKIGKFSYYTLNKEVFLELNNFLMDVYSVRD